MTEVSKHKQAYIATNGNNPPALISTGIECFSQKVQNTTPGVIKLTPPTTTGFAIAIDGPVSVGKSTIARKVAARLGMTYIDTGAMYRAAALYCIRQGIGLQDETAVAAALPNMSITINKQQIILNGEDITQEIRTQAISESASIVASYAPVREKLVAEQRKLAATGQVVMDGRDIASQVLPWAQVKIYLDADVKKRAAWRAADLAAKGQPADLDKILEETIARDHRDKTREHSPLVQTPDAIRIDTSNMTLEEVVECIVSHVK